MPAEVREGQLFVSRVHGSEGSSIVMSTDHPISEFLIACARSGLFPRLSFSRQHGEQASFASVLRDAFERRSYTIRHSVPGDLPALADIEAACWPEPLRVPAGELEARIGRFASGQLVMERDGCVIGSIYSQRIPAAEALRTAVADTVSLLHREDGPILQLLAVNVLPDMQNLGLGDQLLAFMLQYGSVLPGVERIVAVSLCRDYPLHDAIPLEAYIHLRNEEGYLRDPILRFHEAHGGRIAGLCAGYRPRDLDNRGNGILVEYDPWNRRPDTARERISGEGTSGPECVAGPALPLVEACVRQVMGEEKRWSFSPDRPLMDMGLDSLKLMELRELLGRRLGRDLDSAFFFRYGTPEKIARRLEGGESREERLLPPRPDRAESFRFPKGSRPEAAIPDRGWPEKTVAIVGMACRFPGGVENPDDFWGLLRSGTDAVTEIPEERRDAGSGCDSDSETPKGFVSRHGGFIDHVDRFDAPFFNISAREAEEMDPQQRFLLTLAWEALENAGMNPADLAGTRTGVFAGLFAHDYETLRIKDRGSGDFDGFFATGNSAAVAAGRLAYCLGFAGPALAVDTACSSSLVAVHLACRSLRSGESDLALACGVNLLLSSELTVAFSRSGMLSPTGRCRTFDASADGYVRSEGCGVVVLKLLSRALADGDPVWAVLRGSAINQDGASNGLTAPNGLAQEAVIRAALSDAEVAPGEVSYIEAHGTGTSLGDPVEVSALANVYGQGRRSDDPLFLGSVKANIGHAEAAAGIAGLIKVALAMKHGYIPPQLHFTKPNPQIALDSIPAAIPVAGVPWLSGSSGRRLAGVSSFGFSGTNAHVVVEEAPEAGREGKSGPERSLRILALSAKTEEALDRLADRYETFLGSAPETPLADLCHTANTGRAHFGSRMGIVAASTAELREKLRSRRSGKANGVFRGNAPSPPGVAFLFTGQGAQFAGMGRELYDTQPTFREALLRCGELLKDQLDPPLLEAIYPAENGDCGRVDQTAYTQPALFALEYALYSLWKSWGVEPNAVLGHSVGEYVAACAAGVFSLEEGIGLIAERGRLMQALPPDGAMAAVFADEGVAAEAIGPFREEISIAAVNGPRLTVISGRADSVEQVTKTLASRGVRCTRLNVSHAFHSPLTEHVLEPFREAARRIRYASPRIDLISNLTGDFIGDEIATADYWVRHVRETVRFAAGIESLYRGGYRIFVEIGPQPVLAGMGKAFLPAGCVYLPSLRRGRPDWEPLLHSLGTLYVMGMKIDWRAFDGEHALGKIPLPTYPFEGRRYWFKTAKTGEPIKAPCGNLSRESGRQDPKTENLLYRVEWHRRDTAPKRASISLPSPARLRERLQPAAGGRIEPLSDLPPRMEALSLSYIQAALTRLGWNFSRGVRFRIADATGKLRVADKYRPLLGRLLEILAEEGIVHRSPDLWEAKDSWGSPNAEERRRELLAGFPRAEVELTLLGRCGAGLAGVLRGEIDPLDLLFPEADLTTAARLYEDSLTFGGMNRLVGDAFAAIFADRDDGRKMRILEIGAGTGGTTTAVLQRLRGKSATYTFTDVSALFLTKGKERFPEEFLDFRRLDIEKNPQEQGFGPGEYDVILAANVLHATEDLRRTLGNVRKLLAPGGRLVLLEGIEPRRWLDLIFGLLDGWWKFRDHDLRPSHPLLDAASWEKLLGESGFAETAAVLPGPGLFAQAVILAGISPEAHPIPLAEPRHWLLCSDAAGVGARLSGRLSDRGDLVTTVFPGIRFSGNGDGPFTVRPEEPQDFRRLLTDATKGKPALHGVVHLWGIDARTPAGPEGCAEQAESLGLCTGLLHLVQALVDPAVAMPPSLSLVTRQAVSADGTERLGSGLAQSPLWGLAQVIAAEHPELRCLRIDLDSGLEEIDALCDEIVHPGREDRIALRGHTRYEARLVPWRDGEGVDFQAPRIRADGSYLISGGLGGTGLKIADRLLKRGAGQVVLLGRSGRPAEGTSAAAALRRWEKAGANVIVVRADVSRRGDLKEVLSAINTSKFPLQGVIHAAGVFEDRLLADHQGDLFRRVFAGKVAGAWNLHELTKEIPLDFFILFSSATSFVCSSGLGNYVAANSYLDALARYRRSIDLPGLSIGWGPWTGTGMAGAVGEKRLAQWAAQGLSSLAPEKALALFDRLIGSAESQVTAMAMDWSLFFRSQADLARAVFFEKIPGREAALRTEPENILRRLKEAPEDRRMGLLRDHLTSRIAGLLGLNPAAVDAERGFFQMGMDSLTSMELRNRLQMDFSRTLAATLIFRHPTVKSLAGYLLGAVIPSATATSGTADLPAGTNEEVGKSDGKEDGRSLDALSEKEAEALLVEKLKKLRY